MIKMGLFSVFKPKVKNENHKPNYSIKNDKKKEMMARDDKFEIKQEEQPEESEEEEEKFIESK